MKLVDSMAGLALVLLTLSYTYVASAASSQVSSESLEAMRMAQAVESALGSFAPEELLRPGSAQASVDGVRVTISASFGDVHGLFRWSFRTEFGRIEVAMSCEP